MSDAREAATGAGGNLTNHPGLGGNAWAPLDVDGVKIACSELARLPRDVALASPVRALSVLCFVYRVALFKTCRITAMQIRNTVMQPKLNANLNLQGHYKTASSPGVCSLDFRPCCALAVGRPIPARREKTAKCGLTCSTSLGLRSLSIRPRDQHD